jgi:hypothetical protein
VDLAAGSSGDNAHGLAVDVELEAVIADGDCDDLRAWIIPTWMRWVATMMEPR